MINNLIPGTTNLGIGITCCNTYMSDFVKLPLLYPGHITENIDDYTKHSNSQPEAANSPVRFSNQSAGVPGARSHAGFERDLHIGDSA